MTANKALKRMQRLAYAVACVAGVVQPASSPAHAVVVTSDVETALALAGRIGRKDHIHIALNSEDAIRYARTNPVDMVIADATSGASQHGALLAMQAKGASVVLAGVKSTAFINYVMDGVLPQLAALPRRAVQAPVRTPIPLPSAATRPATTIRDGRSGMVPVSV